MTTSFTNTQHLTFTKNETLQILLGVGILFGCAQISIPLQPVPITLQTIGVMLIGLFYPRHVAVKTLLSYLILGAMGAPVFANFSGGVGILIGPRGGYLLGFLAAVASMTCARERILKQTYLTMICNCIVGNVLIFLFGISWLSLFVGASQAIQLGFVPFIVPEAIKALFLGATVQYVKS